MLFLVLVLLFLITPLRLDVVIRRQEDVQGAVCMQSGPVRITRPFKVIRTENGGHQLTFLPRHKRDKPAAASPQRAMTLLRALRRADRARRFLLRHTQLLLLRADLRLSLADAQHSALASGTLQALTALVPPRLRTRVQIHALPDFFTGRTVWRVECMVSLRPGILLITGVMALWAYLVEQHSAAPVSKEA